VGDSDTKLKRGHSGGDVGSSDLGKKGGREEGVELATAIYVGR